MLQRKIYDELVKWKNRPHKPLVVKGQRQVGKTFIIEKFGRDNYDVFVEFNLFDRPLVSKIFENDLDVNRIIDELSLISGKEIKSGSTLIFFDEIQESQMVRSSLKAFAEDGRFDVIASGSLLGISEARLGSFSNKGIPPLLPIGYEEHLTMYSMDFEEFLWAMKFPKKKIDTIKKCIKNRMPIGEIELFTLNELFKKYNVVGGMPASVEAYVNNGIKSSDKVLKDILDTCRNDINRYNTGVDIVKTSECFDSIPNQLSDTNKRFMYARITNGQSRSSEQKYGGNLLWIKESGFGNFCYGLTEPASPLDKNVIKDNFRLYLSDTGILMHMMSEASRYAAYTGDTGYNFGAVTENMICEALVKNGILPRYYRKTNGSDKMELDFVIELGTELAVIEVKSGKKRDYASLKKAISVFEFDRKIILEKDNIYVDDEGIEHYPLFSASFINEMKKEYSME